MSVFLIATSRITLGEMLLNLFKYFSEICGEKLIPLEIRQTCRVFL
jgi:hypothetical protein